MLDNNVQINDNETSDSKVLNQDEIDSLLGGGAYSDVSLNQKNGDECFGISI